ncbi:DUF1997 domain-containing protein [Halomicronema hongdechloris]|nr:DUF1997 domain-containing protein [Halomicronema hongdechloris]
MTTALSPLTKPVVDPADIAEASNDKAPATFTGAYIGEMEMIADVSTVASYLDDHPTWFLHCAHPMRAEPLVDNGYALTVGNFSALGYEIEPRIGLHLLPQQAGIYRIETIPISGEEAKHYTVDFRAEMVLKEEATVKGDLITQVSWQLGLTVAIQFPRFIQALPHTLVKTSGDRLLTEVVRQASRRLTRKVQEDFHRRLALPLPSSHQRHRFWHR